MSIGFRLCFAASVLLIASSIAAPAATCMPDVVTAALYDAGTPSKNRKSTVCVRALEMGRGGGQASRFSFRVDVPPAAVKSGRAFRPVSLFGGEASHAARWSYRGPALGYPPARIYPVAIGRDDKPAVAPVLTRSAAVPPPSPVPLPAAGWMLVAGLAGLGLIRRGRT